MRRAHFVRGKHENRYVFDAADRVKLILNPDVTVRKTLEVIKVGLLRIFTRDHRRTIRSQYLIPIKQTLSSLVVV